VHVHPLVEVRDSAAHQHRHRLDRFGLAENFEQNALGVVELGVNLGGQFGA
jgi:hypothetical protein